MIAKTPAGAAVLTRRSHIGSAWISDWNPEDEKYWESKGNPSYGFDFR